MVSPRSLSAAEHYEEVKRNLLQKGLQFPVTAENYVFELVRNFEPQITKPEEAPYLRAIYLLRSAEFCATLNMDRPILESAFRPPIVVTQEDVEIVSLVAVASFGDRWKSVAKNHLAYVASFSGELFRLYQLVGTWKATDLFKKYGKEEALSEVLVKNAGDISTGVADFLRIKAYLWFEISRTIDLSQTLRNLVRL